MNQRHSLLAVEELLVLEHLDGGLGHHALGVHPRQVPGAPPQGLLEPLLLLGVADGDLVVGLALEARLLLLGRGLTLALLLELLLGEVDDLHGVDLLLAQDSEQPEVLILLELVALPWLDPPELGPLAHLDPLTVHELLVVDEVVVVVLGGAEGWSAEALLLGVAVGPGLGRQGVGAALPPRLTLSSLLVTLVCGGPPLELFDGLEVEVLVLVGQAHLLEGVVLGANLHLQGHQRVVQQPVLGVEGHLVLALNEGDVGADVELVLELAHQLEEHLFLLDESKLGAAALRRPSLVLKSLVSSGFGVRVEVLLL